MPKAACKPARVSPRDMLGRTGGRSAKPFRCLPQHCKQHKYIGRLRKHQCRKVAFFDSMAS